MGLVNMLWLMTDPLLQITSIKQEAKGRIGAAKKVTWMLYPPHTCITFILSTCIRDPFEAASSKAAPPPPMVLLRPKTELVKREPSFREDPLEVPSMQFLCAC